MAAVSAELLREAATAIREDQVTPYVSRRGPFFLAVADWLDSEANDVEGTPTPRGLEGFDVIDSAALAVARAYLGRTTP